MYPLTAVLFLLLAGWCSRRLHLGSRMRGTLPLAVAMGCAYAAMVTSRPMDVGGALVAFLFLDMMLLVLGIQSLLLLLRTFDPPLVDEDGEDEGRGGGGPDGDGPQPPVPTGDGGQAPDWRDFDQVRAGWEADSVPPPAALVP